MIWRATILLFAPIFLLGLAAIPLGLLRGPYQWVCFGVALGLTVPAGLSTLFASAWLGKTSPYGGVISLFLGTFLRLLVGFGGGVVVFFAAGPTFRADPVSFWVWLLSAYLITLISEMVLEVRKLFPHSRGTR
jgi:hypothetical protein